MRSFTSFEKKIINKLLTLDNDNCNCICVQNILADQTGIIGKPTDFEFEINGSKSLSIFYYRDICIDDNDFIRRLEKQLFEFVLLMNFLIEEKYIFKISGYLHSKPSINHEYNRQIPLDSKLENMLGQLWNDNFKILFKLEELKKHNYLDSVSYKEQTNRKITIAIAFASIMGSFISSFITPIISYHNIQKISVKELEEINECINTNIQKEYSIIKNEPKVSSEETFSSPEILQAKDLSGDELNVGME